MKRWYEVVIESCYIRRCQGYHLPALEKMLAALQEEMGGRESFLLSLLNNDLFKHCNQPGERAR